MTDTTSGPGFLAVFAALAALTVIRLVALHFSAVGLDPDEAQYWGWSRELAFGYYSKPPLIAWWDAATTAVCGNGLPCLRSPASLAYFADGLVAYWIGRMLYGRWAGAVAAMLLVLAPGLIFSTTLMTTDVPLLLFWTLALLAIVQLRAGRDWRWSVLLGLSFGLGLLSKYAMLYLVPAMALAALVDPPSRRLLRRPSVWLALVAGGSFLVPNLLWNLGNKFVTLVHTAHYVDQKHIDVSMIRPFEFLATQFGVAGPVTFAILFVGVWFHTRGKAAGNDAMLLAYAAIPVAIMVGTAFAAPVEANWAATGYIALFVLAGAMLVRWRRTGLIVFSAILGLVGQAVFILGNAYADQVALPFLRNPAVYHRYLGWPELAQKVEAVAAKNGAASFATNDREAAATLIYHLGADQSRLFAWPGFPPQTHFEFSRPLTPATPGPVLMLADCGDPAAFETYYGSVTPLEPITIPTGANTTKSFTALLLADPKGPLGPLDGCP